MTDEEYERIKADEKAHLRKMKEFKQAARRLQRTKKLQDAAEGVNRAQDTLDENRTLVRQLSEEAAHSEARLDLALEAGGEDATEEKDLDPKARARELVRRLREEMNAGEDEEASTEAAPDDRPDKTIGRAP